MPDKKSKEKPVPSSSNLVKRKASDTKVKQSTVTASNGEAPKPKLARSASVKVKKAPALRAPTPIEEVKKEEINNNANKKPKLSISKMSNSSKRLKLFEIATNEKAGQLYMFGMNDLFQLGIDAVNAPRRKFPCLVEKLEDVEVVDVAAGGLHTVVLTQDGRVFSFGCNDEKALGRITEVADDPEATDELNRTPTEIQFPSNERIVQITAGDSHSAALSKDGKVYIWGTFRGGNGVIGLLANFDSKLVDLPQLIEFENGMETPRIIKISSGYHHLAMLDDSGTVYTIGSSEQGQLGRNQSGNYTCTTLTLRSKSRAQLAKSQEDYELTPNDVKFSRNNKISDIYASGFATFCKSKSEYFAFGLNNYGQLGIDLKSNTNNCIYGPKVCTAFKKIKSIASIASGEHHTLILSTDGDIYGIGRAHNGRLGSGDTELDHTLVPKLIEGEIKGNVADVRAGLAVSYAITKDGKLYSWGFGTNWQLAQGNDDDSLEPSECFADIKQNAIKSRVILVSGGGQHVGLILERELKEEDN